MGFRQRENRKLKLYQAASQHCILEIPDLLEEMHLGLPEGHEPEQDRMWCRACGEYHDIKWHELRLASPGDRMTTICKDAKSNRLPRVPSQAGPNYCRWHQTSSPALVGTCAYCSDSLHVHQDEMGAVKSGRAGKGYLKRACDHGHHINAVVPTVGFDLSRAVWQMKRDRRNCIRGAIETKVIEAGKMVTQRAFAGML